ncbi:putative amine oxidase [copper-containing] [Mytilus edulis]
MEMKGPSYTNISGQRWRIIAILLGLLSMGLAIALIVVIIKNNKNDKVESGKCQTTSEKYGKINLELSNTSSIFVHLTRAEIEGLRSFLYNQQELNLVDLKDINVDKNFIFLSDLYLPDKKDVLNYLDRNGPKPPREAHVIIFRGNEQPPYMQEVIVGPLPTPTHYRPVPFRSEKIPFVYRPLFSGNEYYKMIIYLRENIDPFLGVMFMDIFGARLTNCDNACLQFGNGVAVSPTLSGENKRKVWTSLNHISEYSGFRLLDFSVLVDIDMKIFTIEKIWFNSTLFNNITEVLTFYNQNKETIPKIPLPLYSSDDFSTLNQRGIPPMDPSLRNPKQFSPDGKRYNVQGHHVEYMFWKFDFRMSTIHGPQLYDIRFKNERIAYELSIQEIAVFYSGFKPNDILAQFLDSIALIGLQSKVLFPGVDCPEDATLIGSSFHVGGVSSYELTTSFCLFELNTGMPLRRHHSYWFSNGRFYEGMENIVLVLRTIPTIGNYDYIIDFIFYPNGALEVKVTSTGYVRALFYTKGDEKYSFQLHDNFGAPIHHHLFHIKADLDIKGTSNRFATLDINTEEIENQFSEVPVEQIIQLKFNTSVKKTEKDAAYRFNFDAPKYLVMYNEQMKDNYGNVKSYRILNKGMTYQLLPRGYGNEPIASWARYQMAVTKYNDSERTSSSVYGSLDIKEPVVDFQKYIDDNDSILDEDLVAWITMGQYHIPHTEDLPVTTSPGMDNSCLFLPYNYFAEDAAISSKNAVRVEPIERSKRGSTVRVQRYGVKRESTCLPADHNYDELIKQYPKWIIDN